MLAPLRGGGTVRMNDQKRITFSSFMRLKPGPPRACPYLADREARDLGFWTKGMSGPIYQLLLESGWRRSGPIFYRTACDGCQACIPIRLSTDVFRPNRTQRRIVRRNADLVQSCRVAEVGEEQFELFVRYQQARHVGDMCTEWEAFSTGLYHSPLPSTCEFQYRLGGRLVAVMLADETPNAFSAVYAWYDPDEEKRSLGTFMVLSLIEEARRRGHLHVYLGHYIEECRKMNYKTCFQPYELGDADGNWTRFPPAEGDQTETQPKG